MSVVGDQDKRRVESLFHAARGVGEAERGPLLDRECADRPDLRARVESLLAGADRAEVFFESLGRDLFATSGAGESDSLVALREGHDPMLGRTIGKFDIKSVLDGGGMGIVYHAYDRDLQRPVALKFLPPHRVSSDRARRQLLAEARAAAALQHDNICQIHEIDEAPNGEMFIAMPLYEGQTVRELLTTGPPDLATTLSILGQVASGLAVAHAAGIVHRDIKPGNLLLTDDGVVKILDFGLAQISGARASGAGAKGGTVAYMSPEQASHQEIDAPSDLWSLGAVAYHLLTGTLPFQEPRAAETIRSIREDDPKPPVDIDKRVSRPLNDLVLGLLSKDPSHRPDLASVSATIERAEKPGSSGLLGWFVTAGLAAVFATLFVLSTATGGAEVSSSPRDLSEVRAVDSIDPELVRLGGLLVQSVEGERREWTNLPSGVAAPTSFERNPSAGPSRGARGSDAAVWWLSLTALPPGSDARYHVTIAPDDPPTSASTIASIDSNLATDEEVETAGRALAATLLRLPFANVDPADLRVHSNDLTAWSALAEGASRLRRSDFRTATRAISSSVAADSSFAAAHHLLSVARFLLASERRTDATELMQSSARSAARASRHLASLGASFEDPPGVPQLGPRVRAWSAFATGDVPTARQLYTEALATDDEDPIALTAAAVIEFRDPSASEATGGFTRRGDWNRALELAGRAIDTSSGTTIGFAPRIELLLELSEQLGEAARGNCMGVERPGGSQRLAWEAARPETQVPIWPTIRVGRIEWLDCDQARRDVRLEVAAESLFNLADREIERWRAIDDLAAAPWEWQVRAEMRLWAERTAGNATDGLGPRGASGRAFDAAIEATSRRGEASAHDLTLLANTALVAGDDAAVRNYAGMLSELSLVPPNAMHALLASGRIETALRTVPRRADGRRVDLPDGSSAPLEPDVGNVIGELVVRGAAGVPDPAILAGLRRLMRDWEDRHSPQAAAHLRSTSLYWIGPALVLAPELIHDWFDGIDSTPVFYQPYLDEVESPDTFREQLDRVVTSGRDKRDVTTVYLAGLAAQKAGLHEAAAEYFQVAADLRLDVDYAHGGWGLQNLAVLGRARSLAALGRAEEARRTLELLRGRWAVADPSLSVMTTELNEALGALTSAAQPPP